MKVSKQRRQEIRQRIASATAGPWKLGGKYVVRGPKDPGATWQHGDPIVLRVRANQEYRDKDYDEHNAALACHAREDLPDLLDDLEAAYKEIEKLKSLVKE